MLRYFKKRLRHFLLFFYVTSAYLGATHIHHEALASHDDCKVCIVVKNLHSGDTPVPFCLLETQTYDEKIIVPLIL